MIAAQLTASATINGGDANVIMMHAMLGKNDWALFKLAYSILTSDERTVGFLAENLTIFKLLRTNTPIYPGNLRVSGLLRLAQFKILVTAQENDKIAECASALLFEAEQESNDEMRHALRAMSFTIVLSTMGIANYLDNWLDLLQQFQAMTEADELLNGLRDNFEEKSQQSSNMFGMLFAIGSAGISTVARLESVINQLDEVEPVRRSLYLSAVAEFAPDNSVFINGAWVSEQQRNALNADDAAERYQRIAIKSTDWGIRPLIVQCWVARAVMLDEYAKDSEGALKVLDEAVETIGDDVWLSRARAKVHWRAQDHERALVIMRNIADEVGHENHVERTFALREAAISAAMCGEWAQAETWFLESKGAAEQVELPDMLIMAVGLGADAAVAALQIEEVDRALKGLGDALTELEYIDPTSSHRAMYCHQLIRHTVLWVQAHIDKSRIKIDGAPIAIKPSCCSNPEPSKAVLERPLSPLDIAWYLLAESEVASGKNVGIADNLYDRFSGGPIPVMEISLRLRRVQRDITDLNASGFAYHLWSFVEAMVYLSEQGQQIKATYDVFKPARGDIPPVPRSNLSVPTISNTACDAIIAYAIAAACKHSTEALSDLEAALMAEFGSNIAGAALLARANTTDQLPMASSFNDALIDAVRWFRSNAHPTPRFYLLAAIRFFQQAGQSKFKGYLIPIIAAWVRTAWMRIVASETFRLSLPRLTVPAVNAALSIPDNDERFLGTLFLAAASATGAPLSQELRAEYEALATMPEVK